MMKRKAFWVGLTLLLIASTAIVACKQQVPPAPEVKGEIVIGHLEGLTGPLAGGVYHIQTGDRMPSGTSTRKKGASRVISCVPSSSTTRWSLRLH